MSNLTIDVLDVNGKAVDKVELPAEIFDAKTNVSLIHQVVNAQLAAARQGTHATKTRGMVRGGGRKPWRQKGTGRARQGSIRAPQFRGGGVVHGPQPRSYAQRTPKKMKRGALYGALSDRQRGGRIHIVTALLEADTPSTKLARTGIERIADQRKVLLVIGEGDELTLKSARNLPQVHIIAAGQLNTLDVMRAEHVLFTKDAYDAFIEARLGAKTDAKETSK